MLVRWYKYQFLTLFCTTARKHWLLNENNIRTPNIFIVILDSSENINVMGTVLSIYAHSQNCILQTKSKCKFAKVQIF